MTLSLFHIRKRRAAPLVWLMILAMLSPVSPHLAEGIALCIGEDHVGVEEAGAAHHEAGDGRAAPLTSASLEGTRAAASRGASCAMIDAAGALGAASPGNECADIPLRLVQAGDACYQAVQSGGGPEVPPRFASQTAHLAQASNALPAAPAAGAQEPRSLYAPASASTSLAGSTVVLLI